MRTMHLFAGAGGGLLCDLILGHDPIIAVEWDPYCCAVLRERVVDGWFPNLHVWEGDVRLLDPSEYAGRVDCIHAGFPCQDLSTAGPKRGIGEGTRSGLYREVLRIAGIVRPRYIFMENSPAILANALLGTVLRDVATLGYDARWTCLPASAAGAPHCRDRWWCLATRSEPETLAHSHCMRKQREHPRSLETEEWTEQRDGQTGSCREVCEWWSIESLVGRVAARGPIGHTELKRSGTVRFRSKRRSRG